MKQELLFHVVLCVVSLVLFGDRQLFAGGTGLEWWWHFEEEEKQ